MTAIAGIMVPKFVMPEAMQRLSCYVPQGIALEGYLDVLLRGKGALEILPAMGKLLAFAGGFSLIGLIRMRKME
jgi:ABC-2 type transport system permease protein